ncbi:MAG: hypothetical protein ABI612_01890 [Betaproteobacteria bacterium]
MRNPNTVMPPFGKHQVLTEEEIDLIVDFIYRFKREGETTKKHIALLAL